MPLPSAFPFVQKGDASQQYQAWRLEGFTALNTDRGKLYPSSTQGSGTTVALTLYSDFERTASVASGSGTTPGRITLTATNQSGINGSAFVETNEAQSDVELVVQLCTEQDLRNAEDRLEGLLLRDETNFNDAIRRTGVEFYTLVQAKIRPEVTTGSQLHVTGGSRATAGRSGEPELIALSLWTLNREHCWELTGLANPEDFREWAVQDALGRIWLRRAHGGDDGKTQRALLYQQAADRLWGLLSLWVDHDQDLTPDRPALTRSIRIGRA